ncbi:MAG: hypothetical protein ACPGU1_15505 [Myxococcota bacterium]
MVRLFLLGLLLLVALPAQGAYIVEPTMEPVIRPLMTVPSGAPKGTKSAGAQLEQQQITVRFKTASGELVTYTLGHPSQAGPDDLKAGPFSIRASLPESHPLTRAFLAACRGIDDRFRWGFAGTAGEVSPLEVARARLVMVDVDGVRSALEAAIAAAPRDVAVLRQSAVLLQAAGQTEEAKGLLDRARAELPATGGTVYEEAERLALAAIDGTLSPDAGQALVARGPKAACAAIRLADTLDLLGQPKAARQLSEDALIVAPGCRDAHRVVCELLGREKDWPGLLKRSDDGILTFPKHGDFRIQRATALRGLGRNDEARDVLEAEVRKNPQDTGPMSSLAALYTMTRTSESGYAKLDDACRQDPDDIVSCFLAGVIAHYLAKHDACVAHMNALIERLPTQPRVPMYAAISSYWMDKVPDADRLIAKAASISGATDPDVFYCRALIRMKRDREGAVADLERFLTVAHRGWHSQGKIGRVNHELAMLKRGEIPPPAEAHHRRQSGEDAASDTPQPATSSGASGTLGADDLLKDGAGKIAGGLAPLAHVRTDWNPDQITFGFKTPQGDAVTLRLTRANPGGAAPDGALSLGPYLGQVTITTPSGDASKALTSAVDALVARVSGHAPRGPRLRRLQADADPDRARGPPDGATSLPSAHKRHSSGEQTSPLEFWLCIVFLLLSLALSPHLLRTSWRTLVADASPIIGLPAWVALLGLLVVVAVVQLWLVPQQLVTVFAGYGAVNEAWALRPVLKYGAATTALYGPLMGIFGPSTDVMIATNLAFGLGTVLVAGAFTARLGGDRASGLWGVLLVGLLPALLRDRASESILVPMTFWVLASMVHLDGWRRAGGWRHAVGAVVCAALALHARPEAWVVLPMLWLAVVTLHSDGRGWVRLALGALVLALPRLWSLLHYATAASQSGDVPGLADGELAGLIERFIGLNALWWPALFPPLAAWCALFALLQPRVRRLSIGWCLVAILSWQALSTLDLPPVSAPRIQAPAMLWAAMLAAVFLALLTRMHRWGRFVAPLLALVMLIPSSATLELLWHPTNAQRFDRWWDGAIASIDADGRDRCVVALDMSDPPRDSVIRLYPLYELAERSGRLEVFSLTTFLDAPEMVLDGHCEPLYLEGPQCRARFFGFDAAPPKQADPLPICARMDAEFRLKALALEDVDNAGNADFPFYGRSPTLRYGLYRIEGAVK